jgi:hypothetical protein
LNQKILFVPLFFFNFATPPKQPNPNNAHIEVAWGTVLLAYMTKLMERPAFLRADEDFYAKID